MSSTYGNRLKLSIFGESHGKSVGATLDGFPSGFHIVNEKLNYDLKRRSAAGKYGSGRNEIDIPEIVSGVENDLTLGTPITFLFYNKDSRPEDYEDMKNILRPGHSDYTTRIRYGSKSALTGGGHLSGRLTVPITAAGSLCKQFLESKYKVKYVTKVVELGGEKLKKPIDPTTEESAEINLLYEKGKLSKDSFGAIIKIIVNNVPEGLGSPIFGNVESRLSEILFGIPGLKGISFGLGFDIAGLKGSEANDEFYITDKGSVRTRTNNAGGILGGITNGMPLVINLAFKPTPTIGLPQKSVAMEQVNDEERMEEVEFTGKGRHDISYALRVPPVAEAAVSIALLDMILDRDG